MVSIKELAEGLGNNPLNHIPEELAGRKPTAFRLDSREIRPGDIFVCIRGERNDGHSFAPQVAAKGALAIIAEKDAFAGLIPSLAVLRVENSVSAITGLAAQARMRTKAKVVGVTGTAGKTSVKEVLAAVLGVRGVTSKNHLNMNNQIGLPISMLNASEEAEFWVMEAGISEARDMDELGCLLRPDLALILNAGQGHLSGLGDKGVAHYKSRLALHLAEGGTALINADYPELVKESLQHGKKLLLFSGSVSKADFWASYAGAASTLTGRYKVGLQGRECEMLAPFRGSYGAENVAAIAGSAYFLGLTPEEIACGLASAGLPRQRFCCETKAGFILMDDSYNANPLSSGRMLETAAELAGEARLPLVLVMGEMLELGSAAAEEHKILGVKMGAASPALIYWKGGQAAEVCAGLVEAGYKKKFVQVSDPDSFGELSAQIPASGAAVLFKGSRGNRLEELATVFRNRFFINPSERKG